MKTKFYIGILGILLMSCNNFLDADQKGAVIPETVEDYDGMLNNPYSGMLNNMLYMSPEVHVIDDELTNVKKSHLQAYRWADYQYLSGEPDENWNAFYARIAICNEILENIDAATTTTHNEALRQTVKGQAYADRAKCYFALINLYADAYRKDQREKAGVPLILINDIHQKQPRASIGEVYDQICEDMIYAENLVPEHVDAWKKMRASRQGLLAFKAKVYLFMNEIDSAYTAINQAFKYKAILNYVDENTLPTKDLQIYNNEEVIWGANLMMNSWAEYLYYNDDLMNLYNTEADNRFIFHAREHDDSGVPYGGFRYRSKVGRTFAASSAEMYLLRAECLVRKGMYHEAMDDLSTLRKSRYVEGEDYTITATNQADALQKVKEERLRELAFTGLYWFDVRRYQAYGESVPTYTRVINGETYTLAPGSARYTCSIPRSVIAMNPTLTQNLR